MLARRPVKWFRFRMTNWKFGRQSRIERSNRPARTFTFCASTAMLIARTAGSQPRRKNGMGELSRFGELIILDLVGAPDRRGFPGSDQQRSPRLMNSNATQLDDQLCSTQRAWAARLRSISPGNGLSPD